MKRMVMAVAFLCLPVVLFAATEGGEKDIVARTLNFILFAVLLYYFVANPIKDFFNGRANAIANELEKVQTKRKESERALEVAKQSITTAHQKAEEIVENAKREAVILKRKIEEGADRDIEVLVKQHSDSIEFERRRAEQAVIQEVLAELFQSDAVSLDKAAYAEILLKKVA